MAEEREVTDQVATDDVAELIARTGVDDTASRLTEIYERAERAYRAAVLAGHPTAGVAATTEFDRPI